MSILVIEDEKKIAAFLRRGLREEGYAVDTASDGEEGAFMAVEKEYDLIILDIMIPKLDGLSVCRAIRKKGLETPIIMLTAKDTVKDKVAGLDAGADDYLTKPFAFEELLARVRAGLRKNSRNSGTILKIEDLELDPVSHKVLRSKKKLELTSKEYSLLEYMLRNQGKVITRNMIAEHVWDIDFDTGTNVIDVYINYLRKKIDQGFPRKLINTVRGRGYRLGG